MQTRTERRAAEHAARKLANKQLRTQQSQPAEAEPKPPISDIQLEANRANAQRSSGPSSQAGKAKSSMNALKHGLTGKFTLLPGEDADEYQYQLESCLDAHQPATEEELRLTQSLHDCLWRIDRLQYLEAAIMLKGSIEFAEKFEDRTPAERRLLIQAETYLKYEKSIRNLHIQEARLHRTREKDQSELLRLQTIRRREEMLTAVQAEPPQPAEDGFVFSADQNPSASNDSNAQEREAKANV